MRAVQWRHLVARPNMLIYMTDHQRADTVLPGHPAITPNVERLASHGLTFTEAYCPSPHCSPSRAAFHSGLYPSRSGVWNNVCNDQALTRGLADGVRLWSEDLRGAGYQLVFAGKWHVSAEESPKDRGWDERTACGVGKQEHGTGWDDYQKLSRRSRAVSREPGMIRREGYADYETYRTLDGRGKSHDREFVDTGLEALSGLAGCAEPWVLFVGVNGPHDPYFVPAEYVNRYDPADVPLPVSYQDDLKDKPRVYQRMREQLWDQLRPEEIRDAIRHYWAYCTELDAWFGELVSALDRTGAADNTLVLYCSDHGDYCGEHGLFAKGIPCFRGAYNVPTVLRWPAGIASPGRQIDEFVSLCDFGPTFLEVAEVPIERDVTGRSLVPFLRGQAVADWRQEMWSQCNGVELYFTQRSITTKRWKYVFNGFDFDELYDLRNDPHEMRNLARKQGYEDVKRELAQRLWQFACREEDESPSQYITVGLAEYGPGEAFRTG